MNFIFIIINNNKYFYLKNAYMNNFFVFIFHFLKVCFRKKNKQ